VSINDSHTEWFSNSTYQIDYWITTTSAGKEKAPYAELIGHYVDATGSLADFHFFFNAEHSYSHHKRTPTCIAGVCERILAV